MGSGDSARGLCLTSVSLSEADATSDQDTLKKKLKKMYANGGTAFAGPDTFLIVVDLAQVLEGQTLLYNLYRPDAQEKAEPVTIKKGSMGMGEQTFKDNVHMLESVSKNREIFLRVLVPSFVVNIKELQDAYDEFTKPKT